MKSIKTFIFSMITTIAIGFGSATPAFACDSGCIDSPAPAPMSLTTVNISGWSSTDGAAGAVFSGQKGDALASQEGFSGSKVTLDSAGNTCGASCLNTQYTAQGFAQQVGKSASWGSSGASGVPATAAGMTQTGVNTGFSVSIPRPAPAHH